MENLMHHVILSGGSGTRLWPMSRVLSPKQYLPLIEGRSLFEKTIQRHKGLCQEHTVVTNILQYPLAKLQMGSNPARYLLEATGRNTAPAIGMACSLLPPETIVLVTPSDHLIRHEEAYHHAAKLAQGLAEEGALVTFGIHPEYPETGFGYIQAEGQEVTAFKEKPDLLTAQHYLEQGGYYWNAGIFCFKAGVYLQELQRLAPELHQAIYRTKSLQQGPDQEGCYHTTLDEMMEMTDISIDYAVLEHSNKVKVIPCSIGWSDLGSFDALESEFPVDTEHNTVGGESVLTLSSQHNLVLHQSNQNLVLQGVNDLLVVTTQDAIYLGRRGQSQEVRKVVQKLTEDKSPLLLAHAETRTAFGSLRLIEAMHTHLLLEVCVEAASGQVHVDATVLLQHPRIAAATGANLQQWYLQACLSDPSSSTPDPEIPHPRTLNRWSLSLTTGNHLLVLRKA